MKIPETNTVALDNGLLIGGPDKVVIAGPCSVESKEHIMKEAEELKKLGVDILRGGAFKPRTDPDTFQGLGLEGLKFLKAAGDRCSLPVISEITGEHLVEPMYDYVDIYQVGARIMYNYDLLKKLGTVDKPVLLKRAFSATLREWILAAKYITKGGNNRIIFCERGIRSFDPSTRNVLDIGGAVRLRQLTRRPVIADPSHGSGRRELIAPLAKASIAAGLDGLMIESHRNPDEAFTDGKQTVSHEVLKEVLKNVKTE